MRPPHGDIRRVTCEEGSIRVAAGESFCFEYMRHGSVGEDAEFTIDGQCVEFQREEAEYLHPERMEMPGITGADEERVRWIFRATGTGEATIHIRYLFRGTIDRECDIRVIVTG